jgi:hypothetical protein
MGYRFPGIGVVFDIDALDGGMYGHAAWRIFVKTIDAHRLPATLLVEGDTTATLDGRAREFCIGVYGSVLDIEYIREQFELATDPGLAAFHRRFIEKDALDEQPLPLHGRIDAFGRLVTDRWSAFDHSLCQKSSWGYAPASVSDQLDPALHAELKELRNRGLR